MKMEQATSRTSAAIYKVMEPHWCLYIRLEAAQLPLTFFKLLHTSFISKAHNRMILHGVPMLC